MPVLLRTVLFTIFVPGTVAGLVPALLARGSLPGGLDLGAWRYLGVPLAGLGGALYLRCALDFALRGGGTPAPIDPPRILVVRGPYRSVRNPMYLGILAAVGGQALLYETAALVAYAGALAVAFHFFVVAHEEPSLRRRFGLAYEAYRREVPRWLPRVPGGAERSGGAPSGTAARK